MTDPVAEDPDIEPQIQNCLAATRGARNRERSRAYLDARAITEEANTVLIDARALRDYSRATKGRSITICRLKDLQTFSKRMSNRGIRNSMGTQGQKLT